MKYFLVIFGVSKPAEARLTDLPQNPNKKTSKQYYFLLFIQFFKEMLFDCFPNEPA